MAKPVHLVQRTLRLEEQAWIESAWRRIEAGLSAAIDLVVQEA